MAKIFITNDCIGCGVCVASEPDYFEFNDEGLAEPKFENISKDEVEQLFDIANGCPTDAIIFECETIK